MEVLHSAETPQLDGSKQSNTRTREEHDEQTVGQHLADSPPTPRGRQGFYTDRYIFTATQRQGYTGAV
jgi:hypothetical protein